MSWFLDHQHHIQKYTIGINKRIGLSKTEVISQLRIQGSSSGRPLVPWIYRVSWREAEDRLKTLIVGWYFPNSQGLRNYEVTVFVLIAAVEECYTARAHLWGLCSENGVSVRLYIGVNIFNSNCYHNLVSFWLLNRNGRNLGINFQSFALIKTQGGSPRWGIFLQRMLQDMTCMHFPCDTYPNIS